MTATVETATQERGVRAFARRRPLTTFFVLSYAVSWICWTPLLLLGIPTFDPVRHAPSLAVMPGIAIGVTGVAFFVTWLCDGMPGVRALLTRLVSWRHGIQWWLVAIVMFPLMAVIVTLFLGQTDAGASLAATAFAVYPMSYFVHFFFGPLFEETGWRGFALPRMEAKYGPFLGTLYLGLLWATWHFFLYGPAWFATGFLDGIYGVGFFTVTVVAMSFAFTWLSNSTRGSLLLCILLHGSIDGTTTYFQRLADEGIVSADTMGTLVGLGSTIGYIVIAVILIVATRARFSYQGVSSFPGSPGAVQRRRSAHV